MFGTVETSVCDNYNLEYRYLEGSGIIYLGFGLHAAVMLAVTVVLLTISALVSGSEVAFFSLTPRDLQEMRDHDDSRDRAILRMLSDENKIAEMFAPAVCWPRFWSPTLW